MRHEGVTREFKINLMCTLFNNNFKLKPDEDVFYRDVYLNNLVCEETRNHLKHHTDEEKTAKDVNKVNKVWSSGADELRGFEADISK